jgi:hypothetical protein
MLSDLLIILAFICAVVALVCALVPTTFLSMGPTGWIAAAVVAYLLPAAVAAADHLVHGGSSPKPVA